MKRSIHMVLVAGFALGAFNARAQTHLQASIGSWQGYNIISLYGNQMERAGLITWVDHAIMISVVRERLEGA